MKKELNVLEVLPHRPPMLMVDKIISIEEDSCIAVKCISYAEPAFQGHFPGNPVFPGVLIIEALAQTSSVLLIRKFPEKTPLFAGVENARFRRVVTPGDQLRIEANLIAEKKGFYSFEATASVDGEVACTATLTIAMR